MGLLRDRRAAGPHGPGRLHRPQPRAPGRWPTWCRGRAPASPRPVAARADACSARSPAGRAGGLRRARPVRRLRADRRGAARRQYLPAEALAGPGGRARCASSPHPASSTSTGATWTRSGTSTAGSRRSGVTRSASWTASWAGSRARSRPARCSLVTADHGMVDVDPRGWSTSPRCRSWPRTSSSSPGSPAPATCTSPPGGAGRGGRALARACWARARWSRPATRRWRPAGSAPVADARPPVLGDLVVAATGRAGVVDSRTQTPHSLQLRGMHGSLTPGEMLVPLLVVVA